MDDLHKLYPGSLPDVPLSKMKEATPHKKLEYFCQLLKSIRDSWAKNHQILVNFKHEKIGDAEKDVVEQLGKLGFTSKVVIEVAMVVASFDGMIKVAQELFGVSEGGGEMSVGNGKINSTLHPPSPTMSSKGSAPPPPPSPPPTMSSKGSAPPPSTPPTMSSKGSTPPPIPSKGGSTQPTTPLKNRPANGPPLPPPPGGGKLIFQKKSTTKLKRSTEMSSLFQKLKKKMEGSSLSVESTNHAKKKLGGSVGGAQGMAGSIEELTKRSPFFQQIEADVKQHAKPIMELKIAIDSFQTKDMTKLIEFQKNAESFLEILTDETQVLAKFEDFPTKKLEILRAASALHLKLDMLLSNVKKLEIEPPLNQLLSKVEIQLSKVKLELDAFEQIKDEESKKFKSVGIEFDFNIITRIKEEMVDVSSGCMELALNESRDAKSRSRAEAITGSKSKSKEDDGAKLLWKVFQLAFRLYSFAGGVDDRARNLATELTNEILTELS
ncbi:hypothetical protein ACFE04_025958 [Oxalis oulophora]